MLSMRVCRQAEHASDMEYVAAYIQVQVMGVCRVYACMGEATSKVGIQQQRQQ